MALLSVEQAAAFCNIKPGTLRAAISRNRGPEHQTKPYGKKVTRWFTKGALKSWQKAKSR